jgi:hypothetical protein
MSRMSAICHQHGAVQELYFLPCSGDHDEVELVSSDGLTDPNGIVVVVQSELVLVFRVGVHNELERPSFHGVELAVERVLGVVLKKRH